MLQEQWIDIIDFEGYQVSSFGRVRSLGRVIMRKNGKPLTVKQKILKRVKTFQSRTYQKGKRKKFHYYMVMLSGKGKGLKSIHKLVAIYFVPNPEDKSYINHIDGNRKNNIAINLEWVTPKENRNR